MPGNGKKEGKFREEFNKQPTNMPAAMPMRIFQCSFISSKTAA